MTLSSVVWIKHSDQSCIISTTKKKPFTKRSSSKKNGLAQKESHSNTTKQTFMKRSSCLKTYFCRKVTEIPQRTKGHLTTDLQHKNLTQKCTKYQHPLTNRFDYVNPSSHHVNYITFSAIPHFPLSSKSLPTPFHACFIVFTDCIK